MTINTTTRRIALPFPQQLKNNAFRHCNDCRASLADRNAGYWMLCKEHSCSNPTHGNRCMIVEGYFRLEIIEALERGDIDQYNMPSDAYDSNMRHRWMCQECRFHPEDCDCHFRYPTLFRYDYGC